jgi:molybdopterin molybdotransferase
MLHIPNSSPIPLEEAQNRVLSTVGNLRVIHKPLLNSYGYCLAESVTTDHDVPMFDRSTVDGYALQAEDVKSASPTNPIKLHIIEEIPAGHVPQQKVTQGKASRIMTGAPIPEGANAVVMVEKTNIAGKEGKSVCVYKSAFAGECIAPRAQDIEEGKSILKQGTLLGPVELGLLATFGMSVVPVYAKPRVGILSTGSELLNVDEPILPGKLRDSNGTMLAAQVSKVGGDPIYFGIVQDKPEELEKRMIEVLQQVDILVTSGGVSMGDYDYLGLAFERIGAKVIFWKTLTRPGMPFLFGTWQDKPIFALAGNPASSYVNASLYLLPAIRSMCGWADPLPKPVTVICDEPIEGLQMRHTRFLRGLTYVSPSGELRVKICAKQSSNVLSSFLDSNCLVKVPGGKSHDAGDLIQVELFGVIEMLDHQ